jgi:sec-independent protein translocase protein TatC
VLIFILATIITPTPDILTLIAMALPMCLLYESCIWIAWLMERRASKRIAS